MSDKLAELIELIEQSVPYVLATLPHGDVGRSSVTTSHADWAPVHRGRASSARVQLENLLKKARTP